ncbi:hypothetical protein BDD43_3694 [Mucilaginibacter gracilis]|uniref:Uncharacterized protein n=1 Tax=Mucilaginibacter gracilis TaxID=423350 RepID=A0A495J3C4_9SPHI|nr:hypothetical protein [Mucilaginibacter gracilis]RKR83485.1 hypothetical protein BDD43_3694 [Mucilaginibacter gracilis]
MGKAGAGIEIKHKKSEVDCDVKQLRLKIGALISEFRDKYKDAILVTFGSSEEGSYGIGVICHELSVEDK